LKSSANEQGAYSNIGAVELNQTALRGLDAKEECAEQPAMNSKKLYPLYDAVLQTPQKVQNQEF